MEEAFLLLGSNLGESQKHISDALFLLSAETGVVKRLSSLYRTASWGKADQPDFLNQVISIETNLNPEQLLQSILVIEKKLGRQRSEKWGSRIIDIDILFYGDQIIEMENLKIPHPFLHMRRFTLMPLLELDAEILHPVFQLTIKELYQKLDDTLSVVKVSP